MPSGAASDLPMAHRLYHSQEMLSSCSLFIFDQDQSTTIDSTVKCAFLAVNLRYDWLAGCRRDLKSAINSGNDKKIQMTDYEKILNDPITLGEVLPGNYLARFVVDIIGQLDLMGIYEGFCYRTKLQITW